jgi:hypothetical protein
MRYDGTPTGATRLAVEVHPGGRRTIVAQTVARPLRPKLSTLRLDLDPWGHSNEIGIDEDKKRHGTVSASGDKAHFTGNLSGRLVTDEIAMRADDVFERFDAATLLPLAERAFQLAPGATVAVEHKAFKRHFPPTDSPPHMSRPSRNVRFCAK